LDLVPISTACMIHTFHSFEKKIIYGHIEHWNTHSPCGSHKFKYLYTLCIGFVVHGFLIKCNNTQIVSKNYKLLYVIKLHYSTVPKNVSSRISKVILKVFDLVLTWVSSNLRVMLNSFMIQHDIIHVSIFCIGFIFMPYILQFYYKIFF
jgi:hypothetical protein